jgi:GT2 family glycosyltransferase/glycosyltransferase involved in cell wall biosynthesis
MQIIVLGMHRSGTSAVARLINMMGADTGPSHLIGEPAADNEKGFWERQDVRDLDDALLETVGCAWDDVTCFAQDKLLKVEHAELSIQAKRIIFNMDTHRPWVLKEPRLCLTLPFWLPFLEVPVCVLPSRSPLEIAKSLQSRNGFSLVYGVALWEKYTVEALRSSQNPPRIIVSYSRLISNPIDTVHSLYQNLCEFDVQGLRMPSEREILAFVESRLYHQREAVQDTEGTLNESQRQLAKAVEDGSVLSWGKIPDLSAGASEILAQNYQMNSAQQEIAETRRILKSAQEETQNLSQQLENIRCESVDVRQCLETTLGEVAELRQERDAVRHEVIERDQQLQKNRSESLDLRQCLETVQGEAIGLRRDRDSAMAKQNTALAERDAARSQVFEIDQQLEQTQIEAGKLRQDRDVARTQIIGLNQQLEQTQIEAGKLRQDRDAARTQIIGLNQQLEQTQIEAGKLHRRLLVAQNEIEHVRNSQQLSIMVKQNEIETANQQLNDINLQLTHLNQDMVAKDQQLVFLSGELKLLEEWLKQIEQSFISTLHSWRWRVGHSSVSLIEKLLLRRRGLLGADHIQNLLRQFQDWSTKARKWETMVRRTHLPLPSLGSVAPLGEVMASPAPTTACYDLICFANIDWNARYQRPQQLAVQFSRHGHRVFYVVASRCLSPNDAQGFRASVVANNIYEVELMAHAVPDRYSNVLDAANTELFLQSLSRLRDAFGIVDAVCNVHLAFWTPLVLRLRQCWDWRVLYDCMDEWEDFPNIGKPLLEAEKELVQRSDVVTVTAALLEQKWRNDNPRCLLVRNGVDFDFFRQHYQPTHILGDISHPVIGFYGALAEWVNLGLLASMARARPNWSLVLLGDVFVTDLEGLDGLPNVHLLGRRPYEEMPLYLYHFDVCLVPFRINQVTHAVDPVKFYEYISAGKPVISAPLKELEIYKDYLYFAATPDAFVDQIERALAENDLKLQQRRIDLARDNDWRNRYQAMAQAISAVYNRVSIIVVTYKNMDISQLCLEKLLSNTTYPNYEIIVVDNDSKDGTANYLNYMQERYDNIKIIVNNENRGFAAANNQGLAIASGDYLVLLNNDTVPPRGWLAPLLKHLRDAQLGLVGPVTNFVGNEAKIDVSYNNLDEMEHFALHQMRTHEGRIFDIKVLAMFCVAMRRDVYERVGPLDESFGIGMFEDDDYSNRIRQLGYRVVCAEDSFVHHFGQAAFKKLIETGEYHEIWKKNQAYYEQKWGKWNPHIHR